MIATAFGVFGLISFRGARSANYGAQLRTIVRCFASPRNDSKTDTPMFVGFCPALFGSINLP
jgi:hypothetical protein